MPMYVYSVDRIKSYTYGPIGPKQDLHLLIHLLKIIL